MRASWDKWMSSLAYMQQWPTQQRQVSRGGEGVRVEGRVSRGRGRGSTDACETPLSLWAFYILTVLSVWYCWRIPIYRMKNKCVYLATSTKCHYLLKYRCILTKMSHFLGLWLSSSLTPLKTWHFNLMFVV